MINAALQRREAAYAELERRRQNRRNEAALEAPRHRGANITDGENPPTTSLEQVNDAAADFDDVSDDMLRALGEPVDHQDHDPLA